MSPFNTRRGVFNVVCKKSAITAALTWHGENKSCQEIVEHLSELGISVSQNYVYQIRKVWKLSGNERKAVRLRASAVFLRNQLGEKAAFGLISSVVPWSRKKKNLSTDLS